MPLVLEPLRDRARIFVVGNSGSGKSTLAKALAAALGRARVDLDEVAFVDQKGTRRALDESIAMLRVRGGFENAVVEGCYADLVAALAEPDDHLIWLDLPVEACVANAYERPWEPHKWPSKEAQDGFLPNLVVFIATYPASPEPTGRPAHANLFEGFCGTSERFETRPVLG